MASPRAIIQILLTGSRIVGKAFVEAGRQAVKNAKQAPQAAMGNDVAGVGNATSTSKTDQITRQHRMTLDEAQLILNLKESADLDAVMKHYEHLYKANSPPPPPETPPPAGSKVSQVAHSHYLQSKVVSARERIVAELNSTETPPPSDSPNSSPPGQTPPPPQS